MTTADLSSLCHLRRAAAIALLFLAVPATTLARDGAGDDSIGDEDGFFAIDEPAFPDTFLSDRVRVWVGSSFVPPTDFGEVDLGLAQPELRVRVRLPVVDDNNIELTAEFKPSFYGVSGNGNLFEDCPACPSPGNLYATGVALQGGYLLNRNGYLMLEDEQWALLTALYTRARFEPGAFEDSITPGISLGIGYQLPQYLRLAIGVRIERALDGDGVKVNPNGFLRWDPMPDWRLRMRGLGLQLEYRVARGFEVFAAGFRSSDRFRMDNRPNLGSGPTFRDRQVRLGGGFDMKIFSDLRFAGEMGAVLDRRVSFNTRSDGTVDSNGGKPAPYISFRFELRP